MEFAGPFHIQFSSVFVAFRWTSICWMDYDLPPIGLCVSGLAFSLVVEFSSVSRFFFVPLLEIFEICLL